jgi:hypothetical protein
LGDGGMGYMDLAVGMVIYSSVLGVRLGAAPDQAEQVLGSEYVDDIHSRRKFLRRDYGLLELTFTGVSWVCTALCLQAHRLAGDQAVTVPAALLSKFGSPPRSIEFDEFWNRLAASEVVLAEVGREEEHVRYMTGEMKCEVVTSKISTRDDDGEVLWSVTIW